jgi:hypothetical protein
MKYHVYIHDPEGKVLFGDGMKYIPVINGDFKEEYYKRKIIVNLLNYWEKDICSTWHNVSFLKHFEKMGLIPSGKYQCWEEIHFFLRRDIYLQFFEDLTENIIDELYQDLLDNDNIVIHQEDNENFEEFRRDYGFVSGGCDKPGMCHHCEELTHLGNDDYENENAYSSEEDPDIITKCNCKK